MPKPQKNMVIIMSDEHNRDWSGCYGHGQAQTPHLDALAERGTLFANAYCNSPICVPSRAAFATGQYVHQTGHWDNAFAYAGNPLSWHHAARQSGMDCVSIGKLHFRGGDDNGFSEEIIPLHVVDGVGDVKGCIRSPLHAKKGMESMAADAGPGFSDYARYDFAIRDRAVEWLQRHSTKGNKPFVLFVSFVMPHFPLVSPEEFYALYDDLDLGTLQAGLDAPVSNHPVIKALSNHMNYEDYFDDSSREKALKAYLGMVSCIDSLVGDILNVLEETELTDTTTIAYTSDHGDNLGNRGLWGKSVMYEDSVAVPLLLSGPDIPASSVCKTPVSLIDFYPTILQATGIEQAAGDTRPGRSLIDIASKADDTERVVFSEYHAAGSITGMFMLRKGRYKLIEYPSHSPQLFDLMIDPRETTDISQNHERAGTLAELRKALAQIADIDIVNEQAFADQQALIERHGGSSMVLTGTDIPHTPAPGLSP
jgi:choline-sulfatase